MQLTYSNSLLFLAVIAFLIGVVLTLSVITKTDEKVEEDRANTTRATLLLLVAFVLVVLVLVFQRYELADSVKDMLM